MERIRDDSALYKCTLNNNNNNKFISYDGEILHADAYRPCAKHVLGFMSTRGRRYQKK